MAFINKIFNDKWQTIDPGRQMLLKCLGSGPQGDYSFKLWIEEKFLKFDAYYKGKIHGNPKVGEQSFEDVIWHIYKIYGVENVNLSPHEVKKIIEEALVARGWNYSQERVHTVEVKFFDVSEDNCPP